MSNRQWKIGTIILFLLSLFLSFQWYQEWRKNEPFRKELANFQTIVQKWQKEKQIFKQRTLRQAYFLESEKLIKDKEGKGLPGEIMIIVSDQLLKSITLPFLESK